MTWDFRKLLPGHRWVTRAGSKTIVLDGGAVRFDYPRSWVVVPTTGSIAVCDREPPGHESRLEVSYFRLPIPEEVELPPVVDFVDRVTSRDHENSTYGPLREEIRRGIEVAWRDIMAAPRPASSTVRFRVGIARHGSIHCLITYEFLGPNQDRCDAVWEDVLDTLVLDRVISDPARGPAVG